MRRKTAAARKNRKMREEKKIVRERLAALRNRMAEKGWDACLFVCSDFHGSEYIGAYFQ